MPHDDYPSDYRRVLVRTPEGIREDIDRREAERVRRIEKVDPPEQAAIVRKKRPITVTVTGDRGSGKTTLIAVVAQALENSGHAVKKPRGVPNATTAILDLHEQFDITFVEDGPAWSRDSVERGEAPADAEWAHRSPAVRERELLHEAATLRATVDELRGSAAGLSSENARLRAENARLVEVDEALRAEIARLASLRPDPAILRQQIDQAFEEVRQAAYLEMERNRLRTQAEDLKSEARKLGAEGDARLQKARERVTFALTGGFVGDVVVDRSPAVFGALDEVSDEMRVCRPRTLIEQAEDIYRGSREAAATDKLLAANMASMGGYDFDGGC